jgi:hypothetical protein
MKKIFFLIASTLVGACLSCFLVGEIVAAGYGAIAGALIGFALLFRVIGMTGRFVFLGSVVGAIIAPLVFGIGKYALPGAVVGGFLGCLIGLFAERVSEQ